MDEIDHMLKISSSGEGEGRNGKGGDRNFWLQFERQWYLYVSSMEIVQYKLKPSTAQNVQHWNQAFTKPQHNTEYSFKKKKKKKDY